MESQEQLLVESNDQVISVSPVMRGPGTGRLRTTGLLSTRASNLADKSLVADTLQWCAGMFGTQRARFVRRLTDGTWIVQTLVDETAVSQPADQAEIAMAWSVGLSRQPVMVTRPRVATLDGDGVRPIAVTRYVGIPILCQDEFLGIIEMAGSIKFDRDTALDESMSRLSRFAECLRHDPSLQAEPHSIEDDARCALGCAPGSADYIALSDEEWTFVSALEGSMRFDEISSRVTIPKDRLPEVARDLAARGLITLRMPTRPLSSTSGVIGDPPSTGALGDTYTNHSGVNGD